MAVHYSFDAMVGSASLLLLAAVWWAVVALRKRAVSTWLLRVLALCGVLSVVAMEAGWFVTEFGRQPWIARGLLKTAQAVTPAPGVAVQMYVFSVVYVVLAATCWWLLLRVGQNLGEERAS
jgi:cytochrome d ubiquinol oxidase subunit I